MTIRPFPEFLSVPPSSPLSDASLVQRVLGGDPDAFGVLVDRHHARCLRVATHLLGSQDDAEDVVQEAFVRAYRHLGSYRERERFPAWVLRIVVNQCRTRAAREARYASRDSVPEALEADAWQCPPDGERLVDADAQRRLLPRALQTLAPEQREALVLRFADDLSYDDMAALTGAGVSALKMRVQRACARLRTLLAEQLL